MYEIVNGNEIILQFVSDNWMILLLFYSVIRGMFPDSKLIQIVGASFANMFPVLKRK